MKDTLVELIEGLDVSGGIQHVKGLSLEQLQELMIQFAYDSADIRAYTFVVELIRLDTKWEWHYLASVLLSQPLCHLSGAYFSAFYHAVEATKLAPNDKSLKEYLLFFYDIPDEPMSDEYALRISNELLAIDADNAAAKSAMSVYEKRALKNAN